MAAPPSKSLFDMTGVWVLNKRLSDDFDATFAAQGMPWALRKILGFANVSLHLTQTRSLPPDNGTGEPVTSIKAKQVVTPGGFNSEDSYVLDSKAHDATVPIFGNVTVTTRYVPISELEDEDLRRRLETGGGDVAIREIVENKERGWSTDGTWGFEQVDGERHFTRTSVTTTTGDRTVARLVYDYKPE